MQCISAPKLDLSTGTPERGDFVARLMRLTLVMIGKRKLLELELELEAKDGAVVIYTNHQPAKFRYQLVDTGQLGFSQPPSYLSRTLPVMPYAPSNQPAMIFPLPADHLLTIIQYNVLRAIVTNMAIVPIVHLIPMECRAVLNVAPSAFIPSVDCRIVENS